MVTIGELRDNWGPCPFRFYDNWLDDIELMKKAREGWRNFKVGGTHGFILSAKLKFTKEVIKRFLKGCLIPSKNFKDLFSGANGNEKKKVHSIDWVSMCKNKRHGGLGIGRMKDNNKSLLAEWVWRFGIEDNTLWRRVICVRYGIPKTSLVWDWKGITEGSVFIKALSSLFVENTASSRILRGGLKIINGNGNMAEFWDIAGGDSLHLKSACPRIYALAVKKMGVIQDFGSWQGSRWVWEIDLRRPLFY
ncbi:hypothetical protein Dsin_025309 [Dipteronia sinensis]|uniref:Uncharacterized protein n=1 Tax=Dipteronia sinensis TaxID=43782 RepID=A0AAE0DY83_9ROSI|nr:hypothetical protein Dsin_025309 [Dipteronia sinensis]